MCYNSNKTKTYLLIVFKGFAFLMTGSSIYVNFKGLFIVCKSKVMVRLPIFVLFEACVAQITLSRVFLKINKLKITINFQNVILLMLYQFSFLSPYKTQLVVFVKRQHQLIKSLMLNSYRQTVFTYLLQMQ